MPKGVHNKQKRHPQSFYAKVYGISRDQIGRLVRDGVNPDDPAQVSAWIETRTRKIMRRPTTEFREALRNEINLNGNGHERPAPERAMGLKEGMEALRTAEADLSVRYLRAVDAGNPDGIRFWREEWTNIFEQLRRVEAANPEIEREKKEAVRIRDVQIFISEMIGQFRNALDAAPERLAHKLVGLNALQIIEELQKEHRIILRHLKAWPQQIV